MFLGEKGSRGRFFIPAFQGPYYAGIEFQGSRADLRLCLSGIPGSFAAIEEAEVNDHGLHSDHILFLDKRVLLFPEAKCILLFPKDNDRMILYNLDFEKALDKFEGAALAVLSLPPCVAVKGAAYAYPVRVRSKAGGVTFKLESAPQGMTVTPDGRLLWTVPAAFAGREVPVVLTLRDKTGRELFHSFTINVIVGGGG